MSWRDLERAFELIEVHPDLADFVGPREEALVRAAEKALGLTFPPSYREFLLRFGAGGFGGEEFYGVIDEQFEDSSVPNGVWVTLSERRTGLPPDVVVVGATGDGDYYVLRCTDASEPPVVLFQPGWKVQRPEAIAEDFGAFLLDQVRSVLE
ncbi:MAG TPA: SMI1/KNR4 family protein [Anaeromyxobacteraceae bacterium]|nr:SMI1/KNR4 family protein [Anaeromyxobacteraceae bacterium]